MKFLGVITLIFYWIVLPSYGVFGQFNIKVGYNAAFVEAPRLNNMVDVYNSGLVKPYDVLDKFSSLHGLELGVRYRIGNTGFEASWHSGLNTSDVYAEIDGSNYSKKYFISLTEYALQAENYIGYFGFGAGLGYRTARIKTDIPGSRRKRQELDASSGFNGKLYLIFQIPGEKVALAFKPYIQIPLSELSFPGFAEQLGLDASTETKDRFRAFGFSIVLYNGKQ